MLNRNFECGVLVVWAAFCYIGTTLICWISTKLNSMKYIALLDEILLELDIVVTGRIWCFNTITSQYKFSESIKSEYLKNIHFPKWSTISPDLNSIENLWGPMIRRLYTNGKQFSIINELQEQIMLTWSKNNTDELQNLVNSIPNKFIKVIKRNVDHMNY